MPFDYLDDPGRLLDGVIRNHAVELGDKAFCEFEGHPVTYAAFDATVERIARGLVSLGLTPGDAVCVFMSNSPELLHLMFGVHRAGGVYVPCSPHGAPAEIRYQVEHVGARLIVVDPGTLDAGRVVASGTTVERLVLVGGQAPADVFSYDDLLARAEDTEVTLPVLSADDVCTVMYTSGTTSRPKGVMLTHGNHATAASNLVAAYEWHRSDRFLHFFPMYHANGGMVTVFPALLSGATLVMAEKFSASRFSQQLVDHAITFTTVNSTNCRILLSREESPADSAHAVTRMVVGLTLDPETTEAFERRFRTRLCQSYGLTEGNCISLAVPPSAPRRPGSSGAVLRGYQAKVVAEDGSEVPTGDDGELWIRSTQRHGISVGYLHNEELTGRVYTDGWLRTGDRGRFDETGTFWYVGRVTDMIKRSGYNVSPAEVERVISELDGVSAVAVVSTPDPVYDEAIVAFVETAPGHRLTTDAVLDACRGNLSSYKVPQAVAFVDALPVTFVGKLDRAELRSRAAGVAAESA